jgi:hypothetical protein
MESFHEFMIEYKKQLEKGAIVEAYRGLMQYFGQLKSHFKRTHPEYEPGSIYYGYMDMTYFPLFPQSLKRRKLKIAIVFVHETFAFEVWLSANNKRIQKEYWEMVTDSNWNKYRIVAPGPGIDSIIEYTLDDDPDFRDLDALTKKVEQGTLKFTKDVEKFLSKS